MSKIRLSHNRNNIVLIGHMGSGKTSIGKNLSKKIGFDFIDTDEEIENHSKITISEFFKKNGEDKFRKLEEIVIKKLLKNKKKTVIALGGGSFENDRIRNHIINNDFSIWLKCNLKTLSYRCNNRNNRPLLKEKNIRSVLGKLDKIRKRNYMKSNLKIDVSKKTKSLIVREIIDNLINE